jgi:hypothetical protein
VTKHHHVLFFAVSLLEIHHHILLAADDGKDLSRRFNLCRSTVGRSLLKKANAGANRQRGKITVDKNPTFKLTKS